MRLFKAVRLCRILLHGGMFVLVLKGAGHFTWILSQECP